MVPCGQVKISSLGHVSVGLLKIKAMQHNKKTLILFILLCGGVFVTMGYAQQNIQYTQYMYNTVTINPAYAGTRGNMRLSGLYRAQWVGINGAPESFNFAMDAPFSNHVGMGLSLIQDKIGPARESTLAVDYSYLLPINDNLYLSLGLKGGVDILNVDYSLLRLQNPEDFDFQNNIDHSLTPVFGAGAFLFSDTWYFGLSVPNLLETNHFDGAKVSNVKERQNFYAIAGYVFNVSENLKFKPAVLGKLVLGAPLALDLSANFLFNEKFTFGAAYRLDAAVSALVGFQVSNNIMIGYSYDYSTTELSNYNSGSHEVILRFDLFSSNRYRGANSLHPRFF